MRFLIQFLYQTVLGPEAKEGEANVVEVECTGHNNKKYKFPICVMKAGNGASYVTTTKVSVLIFSC